MKLGSIELRDFVAEFVAFILTRDKVVVTEIRRSEGPDETFRSFSDSRDNIELSIDAEIRVIDHMNSRVDMTRIENWTLSVMAGDGLI